jgi:hypothetical protein
MFTLKLSLFGLFAILQGLDIITTYKGLQLSSIEEANSLATAEFKILGQLPSMIIVKVIILSVIGFLSFKLPTQEAIIILVALNAVWIYIVANNFQVLKQNKVV